MALRHREHLPAIIDRENLHSKQQPLKGQLIKQSALTRRPALNELSNNPADNVKHAAKKPEALKDGKPILKKTVSAPALKCPEPKSYSSTQLDTIIDPDEGSQKDPQLVCEYLNGIYEYLRELETKFPIHENYLQGHSATPRMRAILVNWLVQVHSSFKLTLETLHLSVAIIDRYLIINKTIGRETLQLVGASALLVACKYEEIYLPELSDFVYVCDDTFTRKQILQMEMDILRKLEYNLGRPVSIHFLRRYSKIATVKLQEHTLAKYILELALIEYNLCHVKPSVLAAAACCLSICVLQEKAYPIKVWNATLIHYTTYKYSDFEPIIVALANLLLSAPNSKQQAVRSKYSSGAYDKISLDPKLVGRITKKIAESCKTVHAAAKVKK